MSFLTSLNLLDTYNIIPEIDAYFYSITLIAQTLTIPPLKHKHKSRTSNNGSPAFEKQLGTIESYTPTVFCFL